MLIQVPGVGFFLGVGKIGIESYRGLTRSRIGIGHSGRARIKHNLLVGIINHLGAVLHHDQFHNIGRAVDIGTGADRRSGTGDNPLFYLGQFLGGGEKFIPSPRRLGHAGAVQVVFVVIKSQSVDGQRHGVDLVLNGQFVDRGLDEDILVIAECQVVVIFIGFRGRQELAFPAGQPIVMDGNDIRAFVFLGGRSGYRVQNFGLVFLKSESF